MVVPRADLVRELRRQHALGYRLDAVANSVRMQVGVFLALADAARTSDAQQRPLRIIQDDWFAAWSDVTGIAAQAAPAWVSVPLRMREDILIEYRLERIVDLAASKSRPRRALAVKAGWPAGPQAPPSLSYEDRSTDPAIETTRTQVSGYRVLDFGVLDFGVPDIGHAIVYDDIHGVTGRAISGFLGAVFSLIGHAQAVQTRFAIAADGWQVSRTTARKGLSITQTIAIAPDGRVIPKLPEERVDLGAIDDALGRLPMDVIYFPADRSPMPPRP